MSLVPRNKLFGLSIESMFQCAYPGPLRDHVSSVLSTSFINRKGGNDQESIQLPNIFHSKTPKGKKDAHKATAPQSKHYKQKAKRTVSFPNNGQTAIQNRNFTSAYMQRHKMTEIENHSRSIALVNKYYWGGGGGGA